MPIFFILLVCLTGTLSFAKETAQVNASGERVFAAVRGAVFKIKTSPSADSPQASYGTGFVVDKSGLLISNYHVVSDSVVESKKNKIFVMVNDTPVPGTVLAVDVVHDLSLIRVNRQFQTELTFAPDTPSQGEPIFSIGQPEDLNMSIISGTYNDLVNAGPYRLIHLSAPINEGMSGGPTVNRKAQIVGVNVSKLLFANNISFAVPARFAQELLQKHRDKNKSPEKFWPEMQTQLTELQQMLTEQVVKSMAETKEFENWQIPRLPAFLKCWSVSGDSINEDKDLYEINIETCDLQHAAFLSSELQTGTIKMTVRSIENKKLNAWQFYSISGRDNEASAFSGGGFFLQDKKISLTAKGECISNVVVKNEHLKFHVAYCGRKYTYFPDLNQGHLVVTTFGDTGRAVSVDLELQGFTPTNILKITKSLISGIERSKSK